MKSFIPIYRALKLGTKDEYVEGFYSPIIRNDKITPSIDVYNKKGGVFEPHYIDKSTLAIHFEDMLDNEGKKIFVSLSEGGRGGDRYIEFCVDEEEQTFAFDGKEFIPQRFEYKEFKVIGIQE